MANVYLQDSTLTDIGNAIRSKTGNTDLLLPSQMPAAIQSISGGGSGDLPDYSTMTTGAFTPTTGRHYITMSDFGYTSTDEFIDEMKLVIWMGKAQNANATQTNSNFYNCVYTFIPEQAKSRQIIDESNGTVLYPISVMAYVTTSTNLFWTGYNGRSSANWITVNYVLFPNTDKDRLTLNFWDNVDKRYRQIGSTNYAFPSGNAIRYWRIRK